MAGRTFRVVEVPPTQKAVNRSYPVIGADDPPVDSQTEMLLRLLIQDEPVTPKTLEALWTYLLPPGKTWQPAGRPTPVPWCYRRRKGVPPR